MKDKPITINEVEELLKTYTTNVMSASQELAMNYSDKLSELTSDQIRVILRILIMLFPQYDIKAMFLKMLEEERAKSKSSSNEVEENE